MKLRRIIVCKCLVTVMLLLLYVAVAEAADRKSAFPLDKIKLPAGFKIDIYASDIPNARSMVLSPAGTLFVGTCRSVKVYAVQDHNDDFRADAIVTLFVKKRTRAYASIMHMQLDGSGLEIFTHGVRNTVGFDWHPLTSELWFTNNGRDWMGDELPHTKVKKRNCQY